MRGIIRIRDPIHGSIVVSPSELAVVDHRVYQRLRGIKQLGFTDQAFPGATHTRYAHGLGAMEVATRMFDAIFPEGRCALQDADRGRLRQVLRLALLLHDLGHPPGSHASEMAMPQRSTLDLSCFSEAENAEQATHEDYTLKLLLHSDLANVLRDRFVDYGVEPEDIAHLVSGRYPERASTFLAGGIDYFPVLTQMVSGEMDADRMDYLQRDSFFAGVSYGRFDQSWILENLEHHIVDERAYIAITQRAVFAFEDFLLSRYHMFVSIYYHYISVGFETMLARFYREAPEDFCIPSDADAYVALDDIALWSALRTSKNHWAQRIARREAYRRLVELDDPKQIDLEALEAALIADGIDYFISRDKGVLSKYYPAPAQLPIYVRNRDLGVTAPIQDAARVFERYQQPAQLIRTYVRPEHQVRARAALKEVLARRPAS